MSIRLQIVLIVFLVITAGGIMRLLRKKSIDFRYGLVWLLIDVCIMILTIFPQTMEWLAGAVGIASPVNMVLFVGLCLALIVIFFLSLSLSRLSDMSRKLSQEIAIIRKDVHDGDNQVREIIDDVRNEINDSV